MIKETKRTWFLFGFKAHIAVDALAEVRKYGNKFAGRASECVDEKSE